MKVAKLVSALFLTMLVLVALAAPVAAGSPGAGIMACWGNACTGDTVQ